MSAPVDVVAALATRVAILESDGFAQTAETWREIRAAVAAMQAALFDLCEVVEEPPERNCSCHLSPPCNDCVDWSGLRDALAYGRAALVRAGGVA